MLYISILILLFILSYHYDYCSASKGKITWYVLTLIIFILIAGLRYQLGVDAIRYESGYLSMPTLSELPNFDFDSTRYAPGYVVFHAIARSISDEWVAMQFLQAIYVNGIIFWFFYRYSRKIFFCIIIYALSLYFNFMCEVMREACAAVTLLLAWPYFIKGKWIHYYALAIISVLFHTSAFITLVLPILYLPKIRNIFMIGKHTILILIGVFLVGSVVGYALTDYLKVFYFIEGMEKNIDNYANDDLAGQVVNIYGIISNLLLWCVYPYLAIAYIKRHYNGIKNHKLTDPLNFMIGICLIFAVLSIPISIFYRYNNYFFPFAIAAIGNWVYTNRPVANVKLNPNFKYMTWIMIFVPFFFLTTYRYFRIENNLEIYEEARYYPYSSIIEKSTDPARTRVQHYHHAY